ALRIIECLKKSGLEIKDIKQFMEWCAQGSSTYPQRRELFLRQKERVEEEIRKMEKVLDMLRFKCWYYEQAMEDGNEDRLNEMLPDHLPKEIQALYDHAHED
ncbi:MAG: MerR family DNA-binding protein, partial [Anaerotignum sp.]